MLREGKSVWAGKTAVVAMGDLLSLGAFSLVPPITESLVGAFSTEREALCQGMNNKEIAEVMFVSTETVKSHVSTIISKFGVKDRTQVVIASIRAGM